MPSVPSPLAEMEALRHGRAPFAPEARSVNSLGARQVPLLSIMAWRRLIAYPWPGNVPELKAVTKKLAVKELRRLLEPDDLPPEIRR